MVIFLSKVLHETDAFSVQPETDMFGLALDGERQHTFFHEVSSSFRIGALISGKLPFELGSSRMCLYSFYWDLNNIV